MMLFKNTLDNTQADAAADFGTCVIAVGSIVAFPNLINFFFAYAFTSINDCYFYRLIMDALYDAHRFIFTGIIDRIGTEVIKYL